MRSALAALGLALGTATPSWAASTDWTGSASTDWFSAGNWSVGVPISATDANIDTTSPNATLVGTPGAQAYNLVIGSSGTGTLTVQNGGKVTAVRGFIGLASGSTGTVSVDGAGSSWTNFDTLYVGNGGIGTLTIQNRGAVSNTDGYIGYYAGSRGTVTVDGSGSTWANSGLLYVGYGGTGTLNIQNRGQVSNNDIGYIGYSAGSTGTVTVDGSGSTWINSRTLYVGNAGTGTLIIQNDGMVTNTIGVVGQDIGSTGTVSVDGAGSAWVNSSYLLIGNAGNGTLTIQNGGTVTNTNGTIGQGIGSTSTVTVDGAATAVAAGSTWTNSGELNVAYYGTGTLNIQNGGTVTNTVGHISSNTGSTGTVTVDGAGSTWTNSGDLYVGNAGTGTLNIQNGGTVTNSVGHISSNVGSTGTVTVTGTGSTWTNFSYLAVGEFGTGTLIIQSGGRVGDTNGYIGITAGSTSKATVTGTGSSWTNSSALTVGGSGTGTLAIQNGGTVSDTVGYIGSNADSRGTVTVDGTGSSWVNSADLYVGEYGTGRLTIQNGGAVGNTFGTIGLKKGSTGTVTVDGSGSTWVNSNDLYVGKYGTGTLTVQNGGKVTNTAGVVGFDSGLTGTVTIDGPESSWFNSSYLQIGNSGTGTLTIQNGGAVTNTGGTIGLDIGSTGTVTVNGAGSAWTNSNDLNVGLLGTGTLTIKNDGVVTASGSAWIARNANSTGTLNIGAASGQTAAGPGTLNAASVAFGAGAGQIVFNHTATNYTFAPVISGAGTVYVEAGTTVLATNNTYTGPTLIDGGKLVINGSITQSVVTVNSVGTLGGNGTVGGLIVNSGGVVAPGNSIGTLNVAGNVTFDAGSIYQAEVNAAGQSDKIAATGTATINGGAVQVLNTPGAYTMGTRYTLVTATGGVLGTFANAVQPTSLPFLSFGLNYDPDNVYLDISRSAVTFASVGQTPNQTATGGGLDSLPQTGPIFGALAQLDATSARNAYDQLSGEVHASAKTALIEDSGFVRDAMNDRLRSAFDTVGAVRTPVMAYETGGPEYLPATTDRFAVWGSAFGSWGHSDSDGNAARLNRSTRGFFVGGDGLVAETWRLGLLAGYSRNNFNVRDRGSSGTSDNYHLGLYGGAQWGDLALRTGAAYSWHDISTSRSVVVPGFSDSLEGKYNAGTAQVFGELAYGMRAGNVGFEPFANLAYVNLRTDGFRETGGAAALTSSGGSTDAAFSTLGLRASGSLMLGGINATARGTLGWRHAFGDVTPLSTFAFAGGALFTVAGVPIAKNAAVVEAGLDFAIAPSTTLGVSYSGQFASSLSDQSVRGTLNWKF